MPTKAIVVKWHGHGNKCSRKLLIWFRWSSSFCARIMLRRSWKKMANKSKNETNRRMKQTEMVGFGCVWQAWSAYRVLDICLNAFYSPPFNYFIIFLLFFSIKCFKRKSSKVFIVFAGLCTMSCFFTEATEFVQQIEFHAVFIVKSIKHDF